MISAADVPVFRDRGILRLPGAYGEADDDVAVLAGGVRA
ncbi:MAG: hypothetical protein RL588_426 [Pseudomonadota bacterium]|jgi:hypothetical protein